MAEKKVVKKVTKKKAVKKVVKKVEVETKPELTFDEQLALNRRRSAMELANNKAQGVLSRCFNDVSQYLLEEADRDLLKKEHARVSKVLFDMLTIK